MWRRGRGAPARQRGKLCLTPSISSDTLSLVIGLLTLLAVAFGRVPGVDLSRAVLALAGAVALVVCGATDLPSALRHVDGEVLVLLFGLMVVNAALTEAGAFRLLTGLVARGTIGPRRLLAGLVLTCGTLSALFLNDTVALMLTPLVIRSARRLRLPPLPYLLGLALAVNAGSVATVTGNPQNVLVAVAADIGYGAFALRLAPVALMSLAVVFGVVALTFRSQLSGGRSGPAQQAQVELPQVRAGPLVLAGSAALGMLVAFVLGAPVALAAVTAATLVLLGRGRASGNLLRRVDYALLVLFAALFVVVGVMADTGVPQRWLQAWLPTSGPDLRIVGLTGLVTAALSTVVSNVPAVLMLLPATGLESGGPSVLTAAAGIDKQTLALTLAMASTLAGNLTLVASIANLIVAEGARRLKVELGFWTYLKVGVPVTVVTLVLGTLWLAFVAPD
ncbi:MAG TPA: SLC13 family permease [Trueperaceae bacterium]